jgi:6-pyruvoyltetrahydropterin/6-carboxytetrahydropterin synthase
VFRQFRAPDTHCSKLHGYPLAFEFTFEADDLDSRNWVISFGELKPLKEWLKSTFDHKLCVSIHDPKLAAILELEEVHGIAQVVFVEEVGCEMFAKMAYEKAEEILEDIQDEGRANSARLKCVKVSEHDGNTAIYYGPEAREIGSTLDIEDEMDRPVSDLIHDWINAIQPRRDITIPRPGPFYDMDTDSFLSFQR